MYKHHIHFYGEFRNGDANGEGVLVNKNGDPMAEGIFVNNRMKYKGKINNIIDNRWIY